MLSSILASLLLAPLAALPGQAEASCPAENAGHAGLEESLRMIALFEADADDIAPLLECLSPQGRTLAQGSLLLRQGEAQQAADLLASEVLPRHHTLPRWSIMHERLGDAFAAMGRSADAQAQWRLALATDYDPGGTLWDPEAVQAKLEASQSAGVAPLLPLIRYHDAITILLTDSVEPTEDGVAYSKLVLLEQDSGQTAYGIDSYEVKCDAPERRVMGVIGYGADGAKVREVGAMSWERDLPGEPFLPTERRLVCSFPGDLPVAEHEADYPAMLAAYRSGEDPFE